MILIKLFKEECDITKFRGTPEEGVKSRDISQFYSQMIKMTISVNRREVFPMFFIFM